jgi:hypothetical protein
LIALIEYSVSATIVGVSTLSFDESIAQNSPEQ